MKFELNKKIKEGKRISLVMCTSVTFSINVSSVFVVASVDLLFCVNYSSELHFPCGSPRSDCRCSQLGSRVAFYRPQSCQSQTLLVKCKSKLKIKTPSLILTISEETWDKSCLFYTVTGCCCCFTSFKLCFNL